ncbi:hypothetical protein [Actinomycetospora aeridis]|uniref:Uncharacterized protein n=1 Tax=Actinomycetospora aeridis TaxID=3129231 RepID=A0ABU8NCS0_9PSEU
MAMTLLGDFTAISGNDVISVPKSAPGTEVFVSTFDTGGCQRFGSALLMLSVRLVGTQEASADVLVNSASAGIVVAASTNEFRVKILTFPATSLRADRGENNRISLSNVTQPLEIKTILCFFHQATDG